MTTRYALYYLPAAESLLGRFGCEWLGWDPNAGVDFPLSPLPGFDCAARHEIVETPRRYGFHATLKAPMKLAPGRTADALLTATGKFAARMPPVTGIPMQMARLGRFLALVPAEPVPDLFALAARCVTEFDTFRAPLEPQDRTRRRPERLTPRQRDCLDRWGYPYVLEEFRFHMTLTGALAPELLDRVRKVLVPTVEDLVCGPIDLDAIAVSIQDRPEAAFRLLKRFPLQGTV